MPPRQPQRRPSFTTRFSQETHRLDDLASKGPSLKECCPGWLLSLVKVMYFTLRHWIPQIWSIWGETSPLLLMSHMQNFLHESHTIRIFDTNGLSNSVVRHFSRWECRSHMSLALPMADRKCVPNRFFSLLSMSSDTDSSSFWMRLSSEVPEISASCFTSDTDP